MMADHVLRLAYLTVTNAFAIAAYRIAFGMPEAVTGPQPEPLAATQLWVVPNLSGRNAHSSPADLSTAYREVATAAGLDLRPTCRLLASRHVRRRVFEKDSNPMAVTCAVARPPHAGKQITADQRVAYVSEGRLHPKANVF